MPHESKPEKEKLTLEEWRARRALRREKQREENFGRAAKMHKVGLEMEAAGIEQSLAARHLLTRREHRLSDSRHVRED